MTKTPKSRIGKLIRNRALSYPETTEDFPGYRRKLSRGRSEASAGQAAATVAKMS